MVAGLADIQPQCLISRAGVVADDKRDITADFQALAELADITPGIASGEGRSPEPVPGQVMNNIGELMYIDQDLS